MNLLDPTFIRDRVDYSFGDQSGTHLDYGYMKPANIGNAEFMSKVNQIKLLGRNLMTLFIDNIRLYFRENAKLTNLELNNPSAASFKIARLQEFRNEDLLHLCSQIPDMNFVIFTGFEDTPTDEIIFERVPENVLGIYASNATTFGGKVYPIPYGLQRKLFPHDNRHNIILKLLNFDFEPRKKLYINHSVHANPKRQEINNFFVDKTWATVEGPKDIGDASYETYLTQIKNHKFMICPDGNAIGCECHRDWEVLYMRRVPIVVRSEYLEKIFENIPVLFVNSFFEITEELLDENEFLFEKMKTFDLTKLDIKKIYENIINSHGIYTT